MPVVISHQSALEIWNHPDAWTLLQQDRTGGRVGPSRYLPEELVREAASGFRPLQHLVESADNGAGPVHVLSEDDGTRSRSKLVTSHLCTASLPRRSLVEVCEGIFIASPELCLLQMSTVLPRIDLIELAYGICGTYAVGPQYERGFADRPALTTTCSLAAYLTDARGMRGASTALRAVASALDRSRSPMETALAMALTLPTKLGGYQIRPCVLNVEIPVPVELQGRYTMREKIECDLYWPGLDVEYDSELHHGSDRKQRALDANRPIVLEKMGIKHIGVTPFQMGRIDEFDIVALSIREHLGLAMRHVSDQRSIQRVRLRRYLMTPPYKRAALFNETRWQFDGRLRSR